MINLFFIFVSSMVICMTLIPILMKSAAYLHVVDLPGGRKMHAEPIARIGGIAFATGALVSLLIWLPLDRLMVAYLLGAGVIVCFGVLDDRFGLHFKKKFLAQLAAAVIVVEVGEVHLTTFPFMDEMAIPVWVSVPLTVLTLLGVTNAINLSDGLDGLAGGLSLLSFGGIAYLAYLAADPLVLSLSLAAMGGILGFLRFNTYPARIFMGDGGSQFLGFSLGVAAILLTDGIRGGYSPWVALLILGLPILDTLGVMAQRWTEGRSLFVADRNHLHHKLLAIGSYHHEAVTLIYAFQAMMVSLAVLLHWRGEMFLMAAWGMMALSVSSLFFLAGQGRVQLHRPDREHALSISMVRKVRESRLFSELPTQLLGAGIPLFLVVSVFIPRQIPGDFGLLAIILFSLLLLGLLFFRRSAPLLIRLGLYVGGAFIVYLNEQSPSGSGWPIHTFLNLFFIGVAVMVLIAIQVNREQPFQMTPLDYLVLFFTLIVPVLPEMRVGEILVGLIAGKLIILFFAYELLLSRLSERTMQLGLSALWALLVLGVRAWVV
ncbi:MAG: undecaprenyl/decaprenyl-phosphate alpha-N-acetylglucosaminyl 1-phosphate transferase [Nitrospirae bacterium]|nr:undecaprenyl/decaprenyl-phosphate alpha-N-acetylglucosaminyl 1-phosphate transferase [Candidatus Manganitrophaceae bacterium]